MSDHHRRLERMYIAAPVNDVPTITISGGRATVEFKVLDEFFHSAMALHGSVYFKAPDDSACSRSDGIKSFGKATLLQQTIES